MIVLQAVKKIGKILEIPGGEAGHLEDIVTQARKATVVRDAPELRACLRVEDRGQDVQVQLIPIQTKMTMTNLTDAGIIPPPIGLLRLWGEQMQSRMDHYVMVHSCLILGKS